MYRYLLVSAFACLVCAIAYSPATASSTVDAAMMRYPDISDSQIVFVYDNDVWIAPKDGGTAIPLSSPAGRESYPKFSPDGKWIGFSANYDGNTELYTMPSGGGVPKRLTYNPDSDRMIDFAPDGRVLFATRKPGFPHADGFFFADSEGGLPTELPIAFGAYGAIDDSGEWLAYTMFSGEGATWKRYQGGRAADIWLFNLKTLESERITEHPGADDLPMWHGSTLYYLSDGGPANRRNIWSYDTKTGVRHQVTHLTEYDVRWPSIGPDSIVFQYGSDLRVLNLDSKKVHTVDITIPGDHPDIREQLIDVSGQLDSLGASPNAKRVVGSFRGDIWTVPVKDGYPRNLTATSGVAERFPVWSPDGQWIAYFSDATGEYELYIRPSNGSGEAQQLTSGSETYYDSTKWSPDSKKISYREKSGKYCVYDRDEKETIVVGENPWGRGGLGLEWAKDSNWIAYTLQDDRSRISYIVLYDLANREAHRVTTPAFHCRDITFDRSGDWLFFTTNQDMNLRFGDLDETFIYTDSNLMAALPLREDVDNPFAAKNDDEEMKAEEEEEKEDKADGDVAGKEDDEDKDDSGDNDDEKKDNKDKGKDDPEHLKIDFDGIEQRVILLPVGTGGHHLLGTDKTVLYLKDGRLRQYNLPSKEDKQLLDDVSNFELTPDGKKILVRTRSRKYYFTKAGPGAKAEGTIPIRNMLTELDPRAEWRQMVREAWRIYRDFFYDPGMHGVDWPEQLDHALKLVEFAANKEDVAYVLGEMIAELNVGHAYLWDIPGEGSSHLTIGRLGCDFAPGVDTDGIQGVQITSIYHGGDFEYSQRGPLSQPGVDVNEGDFLLAINGIALSENQSPYSLLAGTSGQPTELTVSVKAIEDDDARSVLVTPVSGDGELRLRDWIEKNRRYVEEQSNGRIGYVYVRNTSEPGLTDLQRQFYSQYAYDGIIIDERWNGGGMIPHRFIEMLNRPVMCYWAVRDGNSGRTPHYSHPGPMAMLANQRAGSGGDAFPYFFRKVGLGPVIGTRTWGGLVGISGNPGLVDGSYLTVPTFGIYEVDGTWAIEGYGVDPDIEVPDDPTLLAQGIDNQLDKAIEVVMEELKTDPWQDPKKPAYPDRSSAGIKVEER